MEREKLWRPHSLIYIVLSIKLVYVCLFPGVMCIPSDIASSPPLRGAPHYLRNAGLDDFSPPLLLYTKVQDFLLL